MSLSSSPLLRKLGGWGGWGPLLPPSPPLPHKIPVTTDPLPRASVSSLVTVIGGQRRSKNKFHEGQGQGPLGRKKNGKTHGIGCIQKMQLLRGLFPPQNTLTEIDGSDSDADRCRGGREDLPCRPTHLGLILNLYPQRRCLGYILFIRQFDRAT